MHLSKLKTEALVLEKKNLLYSPYSQRRIHFPTKYFIYSEEWPIVGFTQFNEFIFFYWPVMKQTEVNASWGMIYFCPVMVF